MSPDLRGQQDATMIECEAVEVVDQGTRSAHHERRSISGYTPPSNKG